MLIATNPKNYRFQWIEGSDIVEVYHSDAVYPDQPIAAHRVSFRYDQAALNKFANETPEYGADYV